MTLETDTAKLGPGCTGTWAPPASCPEDCYFMVEARRRGLEVPALCYPAERRAKFTWLALHHNAQQRKPTPEEIAQEEADQIDAILYPIRNLRLHIGGDCKTEAAARILAAAVGRYLDRAALRGHKVVAWTYTHAWKVIPREAWGRISVLASCHSMEEAEEARARGYAVALAGHPDQPPGIVREGGWNLLTCLHQTKQRPHCGACRACFHDDRLYRAQMAIVFRSHGRAKKLWEGTL